MSRSLLRVSVQRQIIETVSLFIQSGLIKRCITLFGVFVQCTFVLCMSFNTILNKLSSHGARKSTLRAG